jgi:hypothetical protein
MAFKLAKLTGIAAEYACYKDEANMILNLCVFTKDGGNVGTVRIQLEFAMGKWSIPEDPQRTWSRISDLTSGALNAVGGDIVHILDSEPGKASTTIVTLMNVPASDAGMAHAGTGKVLIASEASLKDGGIFWAFEKPSYSEIRLTMIEQMIKAVPPGGLTSEMAAFKTLTGFNTADIKREFWENPTKPNLTWTCCNLFLGCMAIKLASALGKKSGRWLTAGVLELSRADKDVPGSWVTPNGSNFPKTGDFYSISGVNQNGDFQQYKHVGIVGKIENGMWTSLDGGQGGRTKGYDMILWSAPKPVSTSSMNGWIDIDKYFA